MDTTRIKELAKAQGKTLSYVCQLIGRKVYYLNDLKKTPEMMSDKDLRIIAANLSTSVEYLKGETDDPNFHLSSIGLKTFPYEKSGKRPPLSAYPNPSLYGERYSFKQKNTPRLDRQSVFFCLEKPPFDQSLFEVISPLQVFILIRMFTFIISLFR